MNNRNSEMPPYNKNGLSTDNDVQVNDEFQIGNAFQADEESLNETVSSGPEVSPGPNGIRLSKHYFKGVSKSRHADAEATPGESIFAISFCVAGLLIGAILVMRGNIFGGIFAGILLSVIGLCGAATKAILEKNNSEDTKTLLIVLALFAVTLLFIGSVFFLIFKLSSGGRGGF